MIVVKIEIWKDGDPTKVREHSRAYISNDRTTTEVTNGALGSYDARFMQSEHFDPKKIWKRSRAERIHRKARGVWDILYVALRNAGLDKRNPT
ncbi:hypothetical protein LEP1GSC151_2766 [Leptospira interrogans serovar Grippotyphosa str. LT2186]|uniref:Uncharacterized protein n=1 Tax=Leptospira interrogans serovar Grippotyphosa str. LT2186 TaxID=1001599 RepID=M3I8N6_LEPIR|nr:MULTISPECIES: hypothetical protein [Leptospira]EKR46034.1 hypothetical protein LEP1GSC097_0975 [Leptospira interrogans serovar Grippotyphosa str. UI 08368]EMG12177.1 hypothetical protein LEP1GSC151_2766 [Leptospira interrogans serovar Grippotyphosa str. LT2186]EMN83662.1 hypothetical protein LEP1GSC107_1228 [Leptospira interrogans serovar Grippotyphosa str. UI 12769]